MNGIHNHGSIRAKDDFYATQPIATEQLVQLEDLGGCTILEPCCGTGHISKVLTDHGLEVMSSDLVDRGFGKVQDFFDIPSWDGHIVTNPPYSHAQECVQHALDIIPDGRLACFFLKLTFLEGVKRRRLFDSTPPHSRMGKHVESHMRSQCRLRFCQRLSRGIRMVRLAEGIPRVTHSWMVQSDITNNQNQ